MGETWLLAQTTELSLRRDAPDGFCAGKAIQPFTALIPIDDASLEIPDEDGLERQLNQQAQLFSIPLEMVNVHQRYNDALDLSLLRLVGPDLQAIPVFSSILYFQVDRAEVNMPGLPESLKEVSSFRSRKTALAPVSSSQSLFASSSCCRR